MSDIVKRLRDREFFTRTGERHELLTAADRIEALEAALRFYACEGHWEFGGQCDPFSSRCEGPRVARAALDKGDT